MAFYNENIIDEVTSANDIVDVIGSYVNLKRNGRNFLGLCPFHREKTPSFVVSPEKQVFHCFGCSAGGNVIHFISKMENIDFKESIEMLADRANILLPTTSYDVDDKKQKLKSKVYNINKEAAIFYHHNLYDPSSKLGQEYIKKRKLDNNTLKSFLIGYSKNFDDLYKYLKSKGFSDEEILASSLVNKNYQGKFIDRFRKRLIFPICDVRDRIIAFGGRVLDDSLPKYINSPENIVYSKGRNLFGLNVAKKSGLRQIIIVEGYMDAISLHQRGINNVVASLGTALTENQGRLLRKYADEIIISYDSDAAGQAATLRGLDILHTLGCNVRVLQMTGAKDPDEYIIKYGSARFQKLVNEAISLTEFKVKILRNKYNLNNDSEKIEFLTKMAQILSKVDNSIEKEVYIDNISRENNISKEAIYGQINKITYSTNSSEKILLKSKSVLPKKNKEIFEIDEKNLKREKLIIYLLLENSSNIFEKIKNNILPEDFKLNIHKEIVEILYKKLDKLNNSTNNIIDLFEKEEHISYITGIMSEDYQVTDDEKALNDIINRLNTEKLLNKKNEIIKKLDNPENMSEQEKNILEKQLSDILIRLKK